MSTKPTTFAQYMAATTPPRPVTASAQPQDDAAPDDKAPLRATVNDLEANAAHEDQPNPSTVSAAPTVAQSSIPTDSPFYPHAERILTPAPISQYQKADAFDHFYDSKSPAELSQRLQALGLPAEIHQQLVDAKQSTMPIPSHSDRVMEGIGRMMRLDPRVLDLAEKSPNLLKAFLAGQD